MHLDEFGESSVANTAASSVFQLVCKIEARAEGGQGLLFFEDRRAIEIVMNVPWKKDPVAGRHRVSSYDKLISHV
jgi:hypothetical protein